MCDPHIGQKYLATFGEESYWVSPSAVFGFDTRGRHEKYSTPVLYRQLLHEQGDTGTGSWEANSSVSEFFPHKHLTLTVVVMAPNNGNEQSLLSFPSHIHQLQFEQATLPQKHSRTSTKWVLAAAAVALLANALLVNAPANKPPHILPLRLTTPYLIC
ncbi:hypothetical protein CLAIMM_01632 [Cladophialophora immunda]|nr:hypothetical protein CLAIMM_01632 [Cladophialophora immunda]